MTIPSDATSLTATDPELRTKTRSSDLVPRHRTLDGFVEAVSHAEGVGLADVDAFTTLVVQTDNSELWWELSETRVGRDRVPVYQITILQPCRREVVVPSARTPVALRAPSVRADPAHAT